MDVIKGRFSFNPDTEELFYLPNDRKNDNWNRIHANEPVKGFYIGKERFVCVGDKNYKIADLIEVIKGFKEEATWYTSTETILEKQKEDERLHRKIKKDANRIIRKLLIEVQEDRNKAITIKKANPRYYADIYYKSDKWQVKIWTEGSFILGGFHTCKLDAAQEAQELRKANDLPYFNSPYDYPSSEVYKNKRLQEEADTEHVEFTEVEREVIKLRMNNNFLIRNLANG